MTPQPGKTPQTEPAMPKVPPLALRDAYLGVSWQYLYWCLGVLAWTLLCVGYFAMTRQGDMLIIALVLGVLVLAMVVLPTVLFGGQTWHKRLGWITILLFLSAILMFYPTISVIVGVISRILERGRYAKMDPNDIAHFVLAVLTIALHVWTALLARRAGKLVSRLQRGDYDVYDIQIRK